MVLRMKKEIVYRLCMLAFIPITWACMQENKASGPAYLNVSSTAVTVPSDMALEMDPSLEAVPPVTDTVWVSSNRSWTAVTETADGGNWLRADLAERINVTGKDERIPIAVTFDRYRGSQPRTATLTVYGVDADAPVVIDYTQAAYSPSLELSAKDGNNIVGPAGGDGCAIVKCNTTWTVSVDESASDVTPGLSVTAGQDSGEILVSFPANADDEKARIARLVVSAEGCSPKYLDFIQTQSERYFMLAGEVPARLEPYEKEVLIPLRSNGPWTAEITDCTFENASLQPSSGQTAMNGIVFTADHGSDPEVALKQATVIIRREGMEPITVQFSQRGSVHLSVLTYDPEYVYDGRDPYGYENPYRPYMFNGQPFVYPTGIPSSYSTGTFKGIEQDCETEGGQVFTLYGRDCGFWVSPYDYGLCIGKMKGDYVKFPLVEGHRLEAMYYEAACKAATPYTVRSEDGEIIEGGEYTVTSQVVPVESNHHDIHIHNFPGTSADERYSLTLEEDYRFISIKELCLVYE